jgi:hypothetical protein
MVVLTHIVINLMYLNIMILCTIRHMIQNITIHDTNNDLTSMVESKPSYDYKMRIFETK